MKKIVFIFIIILIISTLFYGEEKKTVNDELSFLKQKSLNYRNAGIGILSSGLFITLCGAITLPVGGFCFKYYFENYKNPSEFIWYWKGKLVRNLNYEDYNGYKEMVSYQLGGEICMFLGFGLLTLGIIMDLISIPFFVLYSKYKKSANNISFLINTNQNNDINIAMKINF
jgi:hypothetical protein